MLLGGDPWGSGGKGLTKGPDCKALWEFLALNRWAFSTASCPGFILSFWESGINLLKLGLQQQLFACFPLVFFESDPIRFQELGKKLTAITTCSAPNMTHLGLASDGRGVGGVLLCVVGLLV